MLQRLIFPNLVVSMAFMFQRTLLGLPLVLMLTACISQTQSSHQQAAPEGKVISHRQSAELSQQDRIFTSYDMQALAQIKQDWQQGQYQRSLKNLYHRADGALKRNPDPVVNKTLLPASGNKHDYHSLAVYWWPDPNKKDGLPYIRHDGRFNPEAKTGATDETRLANFCKDIRYLSLAYYFSGKPKYAEKARQQLTTWFIDPDTRMNPNLNYGQAIVGRVDGRGAGIVDSRNLIAVVDSMALLAPQLSADEYQQIRAWFNAYSQWLLTSRNGKAEERATNNHGAWFEAQLVSFLLFSGDEQQAKSRLDSLPQRRIALQFAPNGGAPQELARTRPWHYSNFNLQAYNLLGRYGEKLGVDVWHSAVSDQDGEHSLQQAYRFIAQVVIKPDSWHYLEFEPLDLNRAYLNMREAQRAYPQEPLFSQALHQLAKDTTNQRSELNLYW